MQLQVHRYIKIKERKGKYNMFVNYQVYRQESGFSCIKDVKTGEQLVKYQNDLIGWVF